MSDVEVSENAWWLREDKVHGQPLMTLFQGNRMVTIFALKGAKEDAERVLNALTATADLQAQLNEARGLLREIRNDVPARIIRYSGSDNRGFYTKPNPIIAKIDKLTSTEGAGDD